MSIRDTLNANQNVVVVVAVVVIVVAVGWMFMRGGSGGYGGAGMNMAYYEDTVTKELFAADAGLFPPIESPAGNPAVRAFVYSCADCSDDEARFVAYYQKYTDEAKAQLEAPLGSDAMDDEMRRMEISDSGQLLSIDGRQWYGQNNEGYHRQVENRMRCDDGKRAKICVPPAK